MPHPMSSRTMFRLGVLLGIVGVLFHVVLTPLMGWAITRFSFYNTGITMLGGLFSLLQQGTFLGGRFLMAGSFVVRSAEEAVAGVRGGGSPAVRALR
ncbi:hypothetical protein [Paeniglutamicibacter psychrophenolicus]|uniref:hypothetical protein n=1 Tax=Paeniglutamicibacter psychrophenolicus TaxID=257454 RepID=UPI002784A58F|nr:hypothetical protein [Paeniglutamicibacter psychrophenolicus]MDQ0092762.1 putative membrane protein [Paeniglutamicibacter psychrophenolicus]